jgi:hypothetical protein
VRRLAAIAGLAAAVIAPADRSAAESSRRTWTEEKCVRYGRDWRQALSRLGTEGLRPAFIARHEAFVSGGCAGPRDVCPRTSKEFEMANVLTIRAMNFGAASTFLPFSCRQPE